MEDLSDPVYIQDLRATLSSYYKVRGPGMRGLAPAPVAPPVGWRSLDGSLHLWASVSPQNHDSFSSSKASGPTSSFFDSSACNTCVADALGGTIPCQPTLQLVWSTAWGGLSWKIVSGLAAPGNFLALGFGGPGVNKDGANVFLPLP